MRKETIVANRKDNHGARLTDEAIEALKPRDSRYWASDGRGLWLEVYPTGGKCWRYRYRLDGRAEKVTLGQYPAVSLQQARSKREDLSKMVARGESPAAQKQIPGVRPELWRQPAQRTIQSRVGRKMRMRETDYVPFAFLLFVLARRHRGVSEMLLKEGHGLGWNTTKVLAFLAQARKQVSQLEIRDAMKLDCGAVARAVCELESLGLAARVPTENDQRISLIELRSPEQARALLRTMRKVESETLLGGLTVRERKDFVKLLYKAALHEG